MASAICPTRHFSGWNLLMAKRGVPEHPKTLKLARKLGLPSWAAVGLLEVFWHWCSRYAITGLITAAPDDVADGIRYTGDADALFVALLESGWIDAHPSGYTVHDVADHADNTWKANLKRAGLEFWNYSVPTQETPSQDEITTESQLSSEPPKPEPEPEPEPLLLGGASPPDSPSEPEKSQKPEKIIPPGVVDVLETLQRVAGRKFIPHGSQAGFVRARLKDGATVEQMALVIEHRAALWMNDPRMRDYLRPQTLFCAKHWEDYLPLAVQWANAGRLSPPNSGAKFVAVKDAASNLLEAMRNGA